MACIEESFNMQEGDRLFNEGMYYAVVDTACPATVCGAEWLESFLQVLSPEERASMEEWKSDKKFKFGDGVVYQSLRKVALPVKIAGCHEGLGVEVVDCFIPLLLSKKSMKSAQMKIDLSNDTAIFRGRKIPLEITSSDHYCLPLHDNVVIRKKKNEIKSVMMTVEKIIMIKNLK